MVSDRGSYCRHPSSPTPPSILAHTLSPPTTPLFYACQAAIHTKHFEDKSQGTGQGIGQFRDIKIQPNTIDLSGKLWRWHVLKPGTPEHSGATEYRNSPDFTAVPVFRAVQVFRCSGVPVFRCSWF